MRSFTVNRNDEAQRLDKFIHKVTWGLPSSLMYKFIRTKRIKLNGKRAHENDMLVCGDIVEMYIPEEFFEKETGTSEYDKSTVALDIVYEDDNILICDKKAGILSHTGDESETNSDKLAERDTLLFAIKAYLFKKGEYNGSEENSFAPSLCNRLDRNTGGLIIAAKNAAALRDMNATIRNGGIDKRYLAAVHGNVTPSHATLIAYHTKDPRSKLVRITDREAPRSKKIVTTYKKLSYNRSLDLSLLEIKLETGRTHQIRAHMAHIGHPLLGEGKYAENKNDAKLGYRAQALYSYKLTFSEPIGSLAYLTGRSAEADLGKIKFLSLFKQ